MPRMTTAHFQYLENLLSVYLAVDAGIWLSHLGLSASPTAQNLLGVCLASPSILDGFKLEYSRRQEEKATNSLRCGPGNGDSITSVMPHWSHSV